MCQSCTPRAASAVACESGLNVAGMPTTSECAGASFVTTAFAPIALHAPIVTSPSTFAPAPTVDAVFERRMPLGAARRAPRRLPAEGDAVVEHDVVADDRGLADDDAHAVVDEEAAADRGAGMDLDAREEPHELRAEPRGQAEPAPRAGA